VDAVDQKLRRTAGGSSRRRLAVRIEPECRVVRAMAGNWNVLLSGDDEYGHSQIAADGKHRGCD
jgi:hypothetical protein